MIKTVVCVWVDCDCCEQPYGEEGGARHYTDLAEARQEVTAVGWRIAADGTVTCDTCVAKAACAANGHLWAGPFRLSVPTAGVWRECEVCPASELLGEEPDPATIADWPQGSACWCPHPAEMHTTVVGCWLCECTRGRVQAPMDQAARA